MATRQGSQINAEDGRVIYAWAGLLNGDSGTPAGVQGKAVEYTLIVTGTFGVGGSVALQGSNDGSTFFAMEDVTGSTIAATTNKMWRISHMPRQIKPVVTAGDGTTVLGVNIVGTLR